MPRPVKWDEMRQTVVPFTVDVSHGGGCPDSGLLLGTESDVTVGLQRCADSGCCVKSIHAKYKHLGLKLF